jgi:hypothetical protein
MSKTEKAKEAYRPIGAFSHEEEMAMSGDTIVYFCPKCWYAFPTTELRDSHGTCADLLKGVN